MGPELEAALSDLIEGLRQAVGEELLLVKLYGSRARGTASADSDVDVLVVVRSADATTEDLVSSVAYDVMWRHSFRFLLAVLLLDEPRYRQMLARGYSFARNVEREGVVLWGRAA